MSTIKMLELAAGVEASPEQAALEEVEEKLARLPQKTSGKYSPTRT